LAGVDPTPFQPAEKGVQPGSGGQRTHDFNGGGELMAKILESLQGTVIAGCVLTVIVAIILLVI
jgi:hypothetical protein